MLFLIDCTAMSINCNWINSQHSKLLHKAPLTITAAFSKHSPSSALSPPSSCLLSLAPWSWPDWVVLRLRSQPIPPASSSETHLRPDNLHSTSRPQSLVSRESIMYLLWLILTAHHSTRRQRRRSRFHHSFTRSFQWRLLLILTYPKAVT